MKTTKTGDFGDSQYWTDGSDEDEQIQQRSEIQLKENDELEKGSLHPSQLK